MLRFIVPAVLAAALGSAVAATPVGPALDRAALQVRDPSRVVLTAAARAGDRLVAVGERGVIALSDDDGGSWRQAQVPVSVGLTAVRFPSARVGVAVGHGGVVLLSSDGGERWKRVFDGHAAARLALAVAEASGDARALQDAQRLVADGADKPFLDVLTDDGREILVVGAYGLAFQSLDGGASWRSWIDRLPNPRGLHIYAVRRQGATLVMAGEQGLLMRSDDGGASFRANASPYRGSWFTADFAADGTLVLAGLRGNAWRSTDGGATWSALANPMPAALTASKVTADGALLFVNQAGRVLRQQGDALVPLTAAPVPAPSGFIADRSGRLLTFGVSGVVAVAVPSATASVPVAGGRP